MERKGLTAALLGTILIAAFVMFIPLSDASASEVKTLKVGCTLPLNVGFGVETKKALEIIVPAFNKAGGFDINGQKYKVDLIIYDDKYRPNIGRAAVERLVNKDGVKFNVCQIGSGPTLAGLTVTEPAKVVTFCGGASSKLIGPKTQYTFGTSTTRTSIMALWLTVKKVFPNAKTVVNLSPDDKTGHARAKTETKIAESMGFKVLETIYYPRKTTDFAPFATKVMTLKPDLVDYPGAVAGTQLGLQFKALYEAGFKGGHISAMTPKMDEVTAVAPKEALEGVLATMTATEIPNPPPMAKEFKEAYIKKYGNWSTASLTWIPAWYAFVEAVKKANSVDPQVVAEVISKEGLEWDSPTYKARLVKRPDLGSNRYCDVVGASSYGQIKDGKMHFVGKPDLNEIIVASEKLYGGNWR